MCATRHLERPGQFGGFRWANVVLRHRRLSFGVGNVARKVVPFDSHLERTVQNRVNLCCSERGQALLELGRV